MRIFNAIQTSCTRPTNTLDCMYKQNIIIIIKRVRLCKAEREWLYTLSIRRPQIQYQPIDMKKRTGKIVEEYSWDRAA